MTKQTLWEEDPFDHVPISVGKSFLSTFIATRYSLHKQLGRPLLGQVRKLCVPRKSISVLLCTLGLTPLEQFYESLLDFLDDLEEKDEVVDLLNWNWHVFPIFYLSHWLGILFIPSDSQIFPSMSGMNME